MTIDLYYHFVQSTGIACAALLGLSVLRSNPMNFSARIFALMMLSTICYFIRTHQEFSAFMASPVRLASGALSGFLDVGMNAFSGLFMLWSHTLFKEQKRFPSWLFALFLLQLVLEAVASLVAASRLNEIDLAIGIPFAQFSVLVLPRLLQVVFAGLVIFWALSDLPSELVERRRRTRVFVVCFQGLFSFLSPLVYTLVPQTTHLAYLTHVFIVSVAGLFLFLIAFFNLRTNSDVFIDALESDQPQSTELNPRQSEDLQRLKHILEEEHIYREPGLSIGKLANRLGIPEYRTRRLINEHLGYRNFNVLLHEYRIKDASKMLSDPENARTPILTVALSSGYQSINPFNRAFRDAHGMTPSEFRNRARQHPPSDLSEKSG